MKKIRKTVIARSEATKQSQTRRLLRLCLVSCLAMTALSSPALACPLCKDAISKMEEIWFAIGLNLSIYIMIAVPFLLVGSFVLALYLNYRKRGGK